MSDSPVSEKIARAFERLLTEIDQAEIQRDVLEFRARHPELSDAQIADRLIRSAALKAATTGVVSGAAGGPFALIAMGPDIFNLVRQQSRLVLALAFLHGREPNAPDRLKEVMATLAVSTGASFARRGITQLLEKGLGSQIAYRIAKKLAGRLVARKLPTLAPIAGSVFGGGVNYLAVRSVGKVAAKYYSGRQ